MSHDFNAFFDIPDCSLIESLNITLFLTAEAWVLVWVDPARGTCETSQFCLRVCQVHSAEDVHVHVCCSWTANRSQDELNGHRHVRRCPT